jgi:hypothetical protein
LFYGFCCIVGVVRFVSDIFTAPQKNLEIQQKTALWQDGVKCGSARLVRTGMRIQQNLRIFPLFVKLFCAIVGKILIC